MPTARRPGWTGHHHLVTAPAVVLLALVTGLAASGCRRRAGKPARAALPPVKLPPSTSETQALPALTVTITSRAIFLEHKAIVSVNNGKVDASTKRDGPDGYFIAPLFKALRQVVKKLKAVGKRGGPRFRGQVVLRVDEATPFRLLAETLYTLRNAEFAEWQILTRRVSGAAAAIPMKLPYHRAYPPDPANWYTGAFMPVRVVGLWAVPGTIGKPVPAPIAVQRAFFERIRGHALMSDSGVWPDPKSRSADEDVYLRRALKPTPRARPKRNRASASATDGPVLPSPPHTLRCDGGLGDLSPGDRSVSIRLRVSRTGEVTHLATRGSTPRLDDACLTAWLRPPLNPADVPAGDYGLQLSIGAAPASPHLDLPDTSALVPVEAVIDSAPKRSGPSAPLDLTVMLREKGIDLWSRRKSECISPRGKRPCIPSPGPGGYTTEMFARLSQMAQAIHQRLAANPRFFWERFVVRVVVEPTVKVTDLIRTLDALRERPGRDARRRCRIPILKQDPGSAPYHALRRRWNKLGAPDEPWERDCMFYLVILTVGNG